MGALLTGAAMLLLATGPASRPLWLRMPPPRLHFICYGPPPRRPIYQELTRKADWVGIGGVRTAGESVTLSVEEALKGDPRSGRVAFDPTPTVWQFSEHLVDFYANPTDPPLELAPGQRWIVFLRRLEQRPNMELLAAFREPGLAEMMVRTVLELDSLPDDEAKCRMLVKLIAEGDLHYDCFCLELEEKHNKAEFLALLAPLAETDAEMYTRLVINNPNPDATTLLARSLMRDRFCEREVERHLEMRCGNWADSADRVMRMVSHWRPEVRRVALRVLRTVRHPAASVLAERCLRDEDPSVREVARGWRWTRYLRRDPNLVPRFRKLARDRYPEARQAACSALAALPDRESMYYLYGRALLDPARQVRESINLGPIWRQYPLAFTLIVCWPALLVAAIVFGAWRLFRLKGLPRTVAVGTGCTWLLALVIARAAGFAGANFTLAALAVVPSLAVPVGMVLSVAGYLLIRQARGKAVSARP